MMMLSGIFLVSAVVSGILGVSGETGIISLIFTTSVVMFFVTFILSTYSWITVGGGKHNG